MRYYLNEAPTFSVLMSVYKNDRIEFFSKSFRSITLDQTLKPSEVIIVLDGPVDSEIEQYIDSFADSYPFFNTKKVKLDTNLGLSKALNEGLKYCSSEWIARMDADDISVPSRFEEQINYIINNPQIDILGSYISEFQDDEYSSYAQRVVPQKHNDILRMLRNRNPMNHVTCIYRKCIIDKVGGYSCVAGDFEDYYLWISLFINNFNFANLPKVLVKVRTGNGFLDRRINNRQYTNYSTIQKRLLALRMISRLEYAVNLFKYKVFLILPKEVAAIAYTILLRRRIK